MHHRDSSWEIDRCPIALLIQRGNAYEYCLAHVVPRLMLRVFEYGVSLDRLCCQL